MSMLETRTAQAALAERIWESLHREFGPVRAREAMSRAILDDARAAGEAFARLAPNRPSLAHFATVLSRWQEGGALTIEDVKLTDTTLSFAVTSCAYARAYADMGLTPELGYILSCSRDEPFALGYSGRLAMQRSQTIIEGAPRCRFTFTWTQRPECSQ